MVEEKTKEKGKIKNALKITANAVQFLEGENCHKHAKVPILLLDYVPPKSAHPFAKGERFKMWIKLEDAQWKDMVTQLKKGLKEISIWFDGENRKKLKEFLE